MHKPILAAGLAAALAFSALPAHAQTTNANAVGGVGTSQTVTVRAKIRAINMKTRNVTLVGPEGNVFTVHAGDQVQNLPQVKKGDVVVVHYNRSTVVVLSEPGQPIPPNTLTVAGGTAAPGQLPAGEASGRLVVTGTVVGVDLDAHTLQLVNPKGGRVITVAVTDPQRQQQLAHVNVGDSLTVIYTTAVAVAVEPVKT
jgi:lipopolysaccharide export system protein LptA